MNTPSDSEFRDIFEQSSIGLAILDTAGKVLLLNDAWRRLIPQVLPLAPELTLPLVVAPAHQALVRQRLEQLLNHDIERISLDLTEDNHFSWLRLTVRPQRTAPNQPSRLIATLDDITERKQLQLTHKAQERVLQLFIEYAPASLAMFDRNMYFMAVSKRWISDYQLNDIPLIGRSHYDVFPELPERWRQAHQRALAGEVLRGDDDYFVRPSGQVQWQRWEVRPWYEDEDEQRIGGILLFTEDITQKKQAEEEIRIAATAFESNQCMVVTDHQQRILRVNRAFVATTGYSEAEVIGKTPAMLQSGRHDAAFYDDMWTTLHHSGQWQGEIWNRRKNGEIYPEWLSISAVTNDAGEVTHYVGAFVDTSQHKQALDQIHHLSYFDGLTKLPNRRLLRDRLQQSLLACQRHRCYGAVIFVDLDHFRAINDTQGHDFGDQLLVEMARRLSACVHGDDTVARQGSDEFVLVIDRLNAKYTYAIREAQAIAQRIQHAVRRPLSVNGNDFVFTASLGISLFDGSITEVDELMRRADASMMQVKRLGNDRVHFFDDQMQTALEERMMLESRLRKAIPSQLLLYYQVQVNAQGQPIGAEVLVRWQHPEQGLVSPAAFIPLAEETGLILPMGQWILDSACEQLKRWEAHPHYRHLTLSVNVSARQFQHSELVAEVLSALKRSGANPARLKLELTESMLLEEIGAVIEKMATIKDCGVQFSLDDFGMGFSSLSYLKRLPLNQLKIDQSFVRDVETDPNDAAIVQAILTLGNSLGLNVIAEGVETESQRDFLAAHGCVAYQGYLFGKPMPLADFERHLAQSIP